jgi:hypothetical protein
MYHTQIVSSYHRHVFNGNALIFNTAVPGTCVCSLPGSEGARRKKLMYTQVICFRAWKHNKACY